MERTGNLMAAIVFLEVCLGLFRFFAGASIFSFLHVVTCRLPAGEPVVCGRSHCPECGKILTGFELIPCLSYVLQKGKCRACKASIPPGYLILEVWGGVCFLWSGAMFGWGSWGILSWKAAAAFAYLSVLTVVAVIDWNTRIIYDRFHIMIFLLGVVSFWVFPEHGLWDRMIGAVIVSFPMLVLALCIEGAFGGGDIKLMACSGFLLGWKAVVCGMFLGLIAGGIYCIPMMAAGRLGRKDSFAFGPFLAFGLSLAFFYGDRIADWYLALLR
jgi:leader peptidase (prepilin peptidase)/N-methyltransferase